MRLGENVQPKIYGFIHTATIGNWQEVLNAQLRRIKSSGLYDKTDAIYVGKLGTARHQSTDPKVFVDAKHNIKLAEGFTLSALQQHCREDRDALVWYIHTKGVSWVDRPEMGPIKHWRHAMEHFVIDHHDDCVQALRDHDTCGIFWYPYNGFDGAHFSGNFWWATAYYINTLENVEDWVRTHYLMHNRRIRYEFWIGSNPAVTPKSFFTVPKDAGKLYEYKLPYEEYGKYML